jgi:small subunit ribosomal protein S13
MARLVGVDLPRDKRMEVALTYIYGIGRTRAQQTLKATGVDPDMRSADLSDDQLVKLRDWIEAQYQIVVHPSAAVSRWRDVRTDDLQENTAHAP